jgi:ferritin-like metal-binding protein YciE
MKLQTLEDLLQDQLKDLYSAESQIFKALPRLIRKVSTQSLRQALETHRLETRGQIDRLRKISKMLGFRLAGKRCKAMEGLIKETKESLKMKGDPMMLDAALIAAAQRIEHYEISAYGTARALAEQLGLHDIVTLLQQSLDEEAAADTKLTDIACHDIYSHVPHEEGEAVTAGAEQQTVGAMS